MAAKDDAAAAAVAAAAAALSSASCFFVLRRDLGADLAPFFPPDAPPLVPLLPSLAALPLFAPPRFAPDDALAPPPPAFELPLDLLSGCAGARGATALVGRLLLLLLLLRLLLLLPEALSLLRPSRLFFLPLVVDAVLLDDAENEDEEEELEDEADGTAAVAAAAA